MRIVLTNNAKFNPYTFDEMLKPLAMATDAYNNVQSNLAELGAKADLMRMYANEVPGSKAADMYNSYASDLERQADMLAKHGLSPMSRQGLLDMKRRYSSEITPIETAVTRRRELAEEQRKALLQNPTLMFQRDLTSGGYDSDLDRFIENPEYNYGNSYSGALLTQQVSQAAGNLAKSLSSYGNGKRLDSYTKTFLQSHGFSPEQVLDAINNPDRATSQPVLNAIVEQTVGSSGMGSWADEGTMRKAYDYARQGLWSAVGQTQVSPYEDYEARLNAKTEAEKNLYKLRYGQKTHSGVAINPVNIYSKRKLSKDEETYKKNVSEFSKYFYTDPQGRTGITEEGVKAYRKSDYPLITRTAGPSGISIDDPSSSFKRFMDSIGAYINMENGSGYDSIRLGKAWDKYVNDSPESRTAKYDATKATEYSYPIDKTQQEEILTSIIGALNGKSLIEVDYNPETGKYEDVGGRLPVGNLKDKNGRFVYSVINTPFSVHGSVLDLMGSDNNIHRYRMPVGINPNMENNRDMALIRAYTLQQMINTGIGVDERGNEYELSPEEMALAQERLDMELDNAYLFHSQIGVSNKTKEQEFNPYAI